MDYHHERQPRSLRLSYLLTFVDSRACATGTHSALPDRPPPVSSPVMRNVAEADLGQEKPPSAARLLRRLTRAWSGRRDHEPVTLACMAEAGTGGRVGEVGAALSQSGSPVPASGTRLRRLARVTVMRDAKVWHLIELRRHSVRHAQDP